MSDWITLEIPGEPVAQPRPRAVMRGPRAGMAPPKKAHPVHTWRHRVILAAQAQYDGPPLAGPIALSIVFTLKRPGRFKARRHPDGPIPHDRRPDIDNLTKAVMDGLGSHVWADDAQVCTLSATKLYGGRDGWTGALVTIEPFTGPLPESKPFAHCDACGAPVNEFGTHYAQESEC